MPKPTDTDDSKHVLRFDNARIDATRLDQNGYLEVDAAVTRTGVFVYRHPDGTVTRELRHPDEVFNADSLATLRNRPVTFDHPTSEKIPLLTPKNTRRYAVGNVIGDVTHDESLVKTKLLITDEDAITKVMDEHKPAREISSGYQANVTKEDGIYNGERYDHVMRDIRYNHVAIVPIGKRGRAGADVRMRLDAADAIMIDEDSDEYISIEVAPASEFDELTPRDVTDPQGGIVELMGARKGEDKRVTCQQYKFYKDKGWTLEKAKEWVKNHHTDSGYTQSNDTSKRTDAMKIKVRRDAVATKTFKADAFEIVLDGTPESSEKAIDVLNTRNDAAIEAIRSLEAQNQQLQGRVDAMGESGKVTAKQLDALVKERTDACGAAHYLGVKNYNNLETDQIKKAVVIKAFPKIDTNELTDPYVQGRYDAVVDRIRQENKNLESLANLKDVTTNPELFGLRTDEAGPSPRDKLALDTNDMWKHGTSRAAAAA